MPDLVAVVQLCEDGMGQPIMGVGEDADFYWHGSESWGHGSSPEFRLLAWAWGLR